LIGVEFVRSRATREPFPAALGFSYEVGRQAFHDGLICYPCSGNLGDSLGDTVIIAPPYNVTDGQLSELVDKFARAVETTLMRCNRDAKRP
jgi:adenosylmethionine-8-amino-7-oxononanoate aminotransferase